MPELMENHALIGGSRSGLLKGFERTTLFEHYARPRGRDDATVEIVNDGREATARLQSAVAR